MQMQLTATPNLSLFSSKQLLYGFKNCMFFGLVEKETPNQNILLFTNKKELFKLLQL